MTEPNPPSEANPPPATKSKTSPVLLVMAVAFPVLGLGAFLYMGSQKGAEPLPPAASEQGPDGMTGCLDRVLNTKGKSKTYDSAKLASELAGLATGNLDLSKSQEVSTIRDNDPEVLKSAIQACQASYGGEGGFGTGLFKFNVVTLRNGRVQNGVKVFHNVGDRSSCLTKDSGSCDLTVKAGLTDAITLMASQGALEGKVEVSLEQLKSNKPIEIELESGQHDFVIRVANLDHDGEVDLEVDPVWEAERGDVRSKDCADRGEGPSPECLKARTSGKQAVYRFAGGALKELRVKATFGSDSRERVLTGDDLGGTFVDFDWKPSTRSGVGAAAGPKPSCTNARTEAALSALVGQLRWSSAGSLSAEVQSDGSLTKVQASENVNAISGRKVPVPGGCAPSPIRVRYNASLGQ